MQHPGIDAVLTAGASAFDPTLAATEEAGLADQLALGSFDLSPTMLEAIDQGRAVCGIDAQQYLTGYHPVIFLTIYDRLGMMPVNDVLTGPLFVTKDTAKGGDRTQRPGRPLLRAPRRARPALAVPRPRRLLRDGCRAAAGTAISCRSPMSGFRLVPGVPRG